MPNLAFSSPVVELCRELVRIPSPSGQEKEAAAFVAARMEALGLRVETDELGSVLGTRQGSRPGPTLLMDAHLDTVPACEPAQWRHDPFGAEIEQGRLWGRGSTDTKGALAAMLCAAASVEVFTGTLLLSASVCEENLTAAALAHVLERQPADIVLVGEPTLLRLGTAQKGRAGLVLEASGRSAHTSRPELGDNAVYRMMEAVSRLRALPLPQARDLGSGVCELIEIDSEPRPSLGMVPHRCTARLALRTLPGETAQDLLGRVEGGLRGLAGVEVRFAELHQTSFTGRAIAMPEFVPAWRAQASPLQARLLEALGTAPFAAPYTTNASASAARGIPTFLLGPGSIEQAHTVDEWISIEQLNAAVDAYRTAIRVCLSPSSA